MEIIYHRLEIICPVRDKSRRGLEGLTLGDKSLSSDQRAFYPLHVSLSRTECRAWPVCRLHQTCMSQVELTAGSPHGDTLMNAHLFSFFTFGYGSLHHSFSPYFQGTMLLAPVLASSSLLKGRENKSIL